MTVNVQVSTPTTYSVSKLPTDDVDDGGFCNTYITQEVVSRKVCQVMNRNYTL